MEKFIQLTYENGIKTYIDISKAREIFSNNDVTYIYFSDNDYTKVTESVETILMLCKS